jgi:hypothetical protein
VPSGAIRAARRRGQVDLRRRSPARAFYGSLEWALAAAKAWGPWASSREAWPEASNAYKLAIDIAQQIFRMQLARPQQEAWLTESQGLAVRPPTRCREPIGHMTPSRRWSGAAPAANQRGLIRALKLRAPDERISLRPHNGRPPPFTAPDSARAERRSLPGWVASEGHCDRLHFRRHTGVEGPIEGPLLGTVCLWR